MSDTLYYGQPINPSHPLNRGLVARWSVVPWYMSGPRWIDLCNKRHGTLVNGAAWSKGRPGGSGSINFDGSDDYVSVGNVDVYSLGGGLTVSMWINPTATPATEYSGLVFQRTGDSYAIFFRNTNAFHGWVANSYGTQDTGANTVPYGVWSHCVMTWAADTVTLYVNGRSLSVTGGKSWGAAGTECFIGSASATVERFKGYIDDVRVYSRGLSASEVYQLYSTSMMQVDPTLSWIRKRTWFTGVSGIQFDAAYNSGYQAAQSTYSWNHTWTGTNLGIGVDVAILSVPGTTVTSVTYNGQALSLVIGRSTVTAFGRVESWAATAGQLGNLAAGTYSIAVTLSAVAASASTAVSYTGVHQTSPTEGANSAQATNTGSATDASVALTSVADNCWPHAAIATDDGSVTANQTTRNNVTGALGSGANEDTGPVTPAGATTMSYTGLGIAATWTMTGYVWRPVAAASGSITGSAGLLFGAGASTLTGAGTLAASSTLTFDDGSSTLIGAGAMVGSCPIAFGTGSSTLVGAGALTASSALVFGYGASTLTGDGQLIGSSAIVFGSGSSTMTGAGLLDGSSSLVFGSGSSTLSATGALFGLSEIVLSASATALGAGELSGTATTAFGAGSSTLSGAGSVTGTVALLLSGTGVIDGAGVMVGVVFMSFTGLSTMTGAGALAGSSALVFGVGSTNLTGAGTLAGSTAVVFTVSGTIGVPGDVDGTATMAFTVSGIATNFIAPSMIVSIVNFSHVRTASLELEHVHPTSLIFEHVRQDKLKL